MKIAMKSGLSAVLVCALLGSAGAQEKTVPVAEEGHHQLVLENEYTRVFHVVVAPKDSTLMHQHDRDYVYVMIGSSQVEATKLGASPTEMKLNDGDVKFTKAPLTHKVTNVGETPFVNLTIEVKKASTRAVCGASWAGQAGDKCFDKCEGQSCEEQRVGTDAVRAVIYEPQVGASIGVESKPSLIVALRDVEVTNGSKRVQLKPGETAWIPPDANAQVTAATASGRSKWVVVSFE
jgi:quercetin dioxygenase-like cupin family protein